MTSRATDAGLKQGAKPQLNLRWRAAGRAIIPLYVNASNTLIYSLAQGRIGAGKTTSTAASTVPGIGLASAVPGIGPAWRTDNNSSINTYGHRGVGRAESMVFRSDDFPAIGNGRDLFVGNGKGKM